MIFKAKHNFISGAEITTLDPVQRKLKFIMPRLDSRGDACRKAKKAFDDYQANRQKLNELKENKASQEEIEEVQKMVKDVNEQELLMDFAISSLQQQYDLMLEPKEIKPDVPESQLWKDTFCKYFCEDDLLRIFVSARCGKEYQTYELMELNKPVVEKKS